MGYDYNYYKMKKLLLTQFYPFLRSQLNLNVFESSNIQSNLTMQSKKSSVLKGHLFLVLSWKTSYDLNLY